jgi:hypothetical protein
LSHLVLENTKGKATTVLLDQYEQGESINTKTHFIQEKMHY